MMLGTPRTDARPKQLHGVQVLKVAVDTKWKLLGPKRQEFGARSGRYPVAPN